MSVVLVVAALWGSVGGVVDAAGQTMPGDAPLIQAESLPPGPSAGAPAEEAPTPAPPLPVASAPPADIPHWGILLEAGLPDGLTLSAVYRPFSWIRASAGAGYNMLGYGIRGGVSLVPFDFVLAPSLSLDAGQFFEADATPLLQQVLPGVDLSAAGDIPKHVSYQFGTASLGLEVGSPRHFSIFLRVGLSYIQSTFKGFEALLRTVDPDVEAQDPVLRATIPSAKLGLVTYF